MSVCSNQFPKTDVLYDEISSTNNVSIPVLVGICCLLFLIMFGIFMEEIWFIVHHYPHKTQRNKFIFLLGLYPVIGFMSTLAVLVPTSTLLCELIETIYLSISIVLFLNVLMSYFGGKAHMLEKMSEEKMGFNTPPLCCCCLCLGNRPFNRKHLRIASIMAYQITLVKPLALFVTNVLWTDGRYTPGDETSPTYGVFYTNWFSVASTVFAIWGLAVIFRSTRAKLDAYKIGVKFTCLQLVIIFNNVQFGIIMLLARNDIPECEGTRDSRVRGYRIHHSLLVLEMFLLSFLARYAYRRSDPELLHNNEDVKPVTNGNSVFNLQESSSSQ